MDESEEVNYFNLKDVLIQCYDEVETLKETGG